MDSWVLVPCQRSRLDKLKRLLDSLQHPKDRIIVVTTFPDPIWSEEVGLKGVATFASEEINISKWWNLGLSYIEEGAYGHDYEVLIVSSDVVGTDYSVRLLANFLRQNNLSMCGPNPWRDAQEFYYFDTPRTPQTRVPPEMFMVRGELGLRFDENFRWWYSDDDFEMESRKRGKVGILPGTGLVGEANTPLSEIKQQWAAEDRQKFIAKWDKEPW